jgi:hypothetical protein
MIVISNKTNLVIDDIRIKKPYIISTKKIFNIFYKNEDLLLIQTPECYLPFNYHLYDNRYLQLELVLLNSLDEFKILLDLITSYLYNKISKYYAINPIKPILQDSRIRLSNNNYDTIRVFNNKKTLIDIRNLSKEDRVKCIFQIEKIVIDKNETSIKIKIFQIKKLDTSVDVINLPSLFQEHSKPPPPPGPPPPPPPPFIIKKQLIIPVASQPKVIKSKLQKPPTLQEILLAKTSLKKPIVENRIVQYRPLFGKPTVEEILAGITKLNHIPVDK